MVNSYFFKYSTIIAFYGTGTELVLFAGAAVLVNVNFGVRPTLSATNKGLANIYVAGNNIVITNVTKAIFATHHFVATAGKGEKAVYTTALAQASSSLTFRNVKWQTINEQQVISLFQRKPSALQGESRLHTCLPQIKLISSLMSTLTTRLSTGVRRRLLHEPGALEDSVDSSLNPHSSGDGNVSSESTPTSLVPAWDGSGIMIPTVPENINTHVYVASAIGSCQACNVKPGMYKEDKFGGSCVPLTVYLIHFYAVLYLNRFDIRKLCW